MAIRIPSSDIVTPSIEPVNKPLIWHTLKCELVTPMYGGGVKSTVVDESMPIRASSIRGQLRFWWRLLAKYKWRLDDISQAEFALWGGMSGSNDDDKGGQASQVFIRVSDLPSRQKVKQNLVAYDDKSFNGLKYVLFPAYNETDESLNPHRLLKAEGMTWTLQFAFSEALKNDEDRKNQVIETLRWWANFGGVGFRSRKGLGAVHVTESEDFPNIAQPLNSDDVENAGCVWVQKNNTNPDALSALNTSIQKLSDFRQKPNVGRNTGQQANRPGRSRWPEPDALRRIQRLHAPLHQPEHAAGNLFARAVFGLPIVFHFVGRGEPTDVNLVPKEGERLASPLFLRPVFAGLNNQGQKLWKSSALVLPYQHILDMQVTANGGNYPIWQPTASQHIRPIQDNGGGDPLQAFLTYFAQ